MLTGKITRIFYSIQGEGIFIGYPQVFIRFSGCNLSCRYCDLPKNLPEKEFTVKELSRLVEDIRKERGFIHSISLTGGEPLLQADFLVELTPLLKKKSLPVYLETNGTLAEGLRKVGKHIDFIAMDLKLPSATGEAPLWQEHRDFLRTCLNLPAKTFVKVVVTNRTAASETAYAASILRKAAPEMTLVIQPEVGPEGRPRITDRKLLSLFQTASRILPDTRLIMPIHQILQLP